MGSMVLCGTDPFTIMGGWQWTVLSFMCNDAV
jgi:hypothetical protein